LINNIKSYYWGGGCYYNPYKNNISDVFLGSLLTKAYTLMQGLRLAIKTNIQYLIMVGDSKLVIGKMVSKNVVTDHNLYSILDRAKKEVLKFSSISFFYVLQENNQVAYNFSNKSTLLKEQVININGN
jgi:hypothetical protein